MRNVRFQERLYGICKITGRSVNWFTSSWKRLQCSLHKSAFQKTEINLGYQHEHQQPPDRQQFNWYFSDGSKWNIIKLLSHLEPDSKRESNSFSDRKASVHHVDGHRLIQRSGRHWKVDLWLHHLRALSIQKWKSFDMVSSVFRFPRLSLQPPVAN